jgi:uncharacterized protein with HEPN domain
MRNRLIHAYFVDQDVIWQTIKEESPSFIRQLEKAISTLE